MNVITETVLSAFVFSVTMTTICAVVFKFLYDSPKVFKRTKLKPKNKTNETEV